MKRSVRSSGDPGRSPGRARLALLAVLVALVAVWAPTAAAAGGGSAKKALWHKVDGAAKFAPNGAKQQIRASHMGTYTLDNAEMRSVLSASPMESTAAAERGAQIVSLPSPTGDFQRFTIWDAPVMMPGLARTHPEIRTYAGRGIDDRTATVRISMTPLGFNASVRGKGGAWYIDPMFHADTSVYASYFGRHLAYSHGNFIEREVKQLDKKEPALAAGLGSASPNLSSGGTLRIYRLALLSDPSFAAFWGASNVTAGKVILMTRADQVYEDEMSYRMDLVANNDLVNLNTNAQAFQPNGPCGQAACFTQAQLASCGSGTLSRNRIVLGQIIGAANYDIGHVSVGQDGGGIASLGVVGGNSKAQGCTGIPEPDGDFYVVDYLTHEMGHEFAMDHPFNGTQLNCSSGNRNAGTSYEPGSGSSIMAYAGICSTDDLQPHSDPYFTAISFQESQAYTTSTLNPLNEVQTASLTHFGGGNEVQVVTFGPGFSTTTSSFQVNIGGNDSAVIGAGGLAYSSANIQTAINGITGFAGTVTVAGASATGFTVTYGGASANTDMPNLSLDNVGCGGCFSAVDETNHGGANDSFTLNYNGTDSPVITNGSTYSTAGIQTALQGVSEVQAVSLSGYTTNGASYTLNYGGNDSVPIVRGQNNTTAGIAAAIAGGNEQQQASLTSFNGTTQSLQIQYGGNNSVVLGVGGLPLSNTNVQTAISGIPGFPAGGTVTSSGAGNAGFTVTFGGTLAQQAVSLISIVNCTGSCTSTVRENARGSAGILGTPGTVSVGAVADSGYNVAFNALGNVNALSVTNPSGGVSGSVSTTTEGTPGILPTGATATVAAFGGSGTVISSGFQVTFGGTLAQQDASSLQITNLSSGATAFVGETAHGGPAPYNQGFIQQPTGNTAPTANVPSGPITIPYRTPFALTGSGTDADGDTVTYMWEQFDRGGTTGTSLISSNKTNGPLFREFGTALDASVYDEHGYGVDPCSNGENCVDSNPTRVFPDMQQILDNNTNAETGVCPGGPPPTSPPVPATQVDCLSEWLPTSVYPGPMHFILTTRDGNGGVTESSQVQVNLAPGSGPFLVTSPNTAVTYDGGSTQTVTWDAAGTAGSPVNAANVDILLSTDGGNTFPTVLASSVPNDGSQDVAIPNTGTQHARIEIKASDNIFFDVSNADFSIIEQQTISFDPIADHNFGDPDFDVSATASSGLPVSFTATGACEVTGSTVHITDVGSCEVTAHQPGNDTTAPAPDVPRSFDVDLGNQSITFAKLSSVTYGVSDFSPGASASSGLPVTYHATGAACTIVSGQIHVVDVGKCSVTAVQNGDSHWNPAIDVTRKLVVKPAPTSTTLVGNSPVPAGGIITLTATVTSSGGPPQDGKVKFVTAQGTVLAQVNVTNGSATAHVQAPGSPTKVTITAQYLGTTGGKWKDSKKSPKVKIVVT